MTPVTDRIGRVNAPDIHGERLETLRKQTVERLRTRRAYRPELRAYQLKLSGGGCPRQYAANLTAMGSSKRLTGSMMKDKSQLVTAEDF